MCGCLLCTPNWGPSLQPRHVPWLGIKPVTLWFAGWHSIHWATPARAVKIFLMFTWFLKESLSDSLGDNLFLPSDCLFHKHSSLRRDHVFSAFFVFLVPSRVCDQLKNNKLQPWLVWLSGLSASLWTNGSPVRFPVRAHAWVAGQVPSGSVWKATKHWCFSLSLSPSLPVLSKNK